MERDNLMKVGAFMGERNLMNSIWFGEKQF